MNPGEIVVADINGIVVIPVDRAREVLSVVQDMEQKEAAIIAKIKAGISFRDVDKDSGYDTMLNSQ